MKENIEMFLKYLSSITKEESDFIEHVLNWDDEKKVAFIVAKKIFEGTKPVTKCNRLIRKR